MRTMIKYLFFSVIVLFTSCVVDREKGATVYIKNSSSHQIALTIDEYSGDWEILLLPGEKIEYDEFIGMTKDKSMTYEEALTYGLKCRISMIIRIVYDNEYRITNEQLPDSRKTSDIKNYEATASKHQNIWTFTYTFTDEDYEYAKKFGENLYEIE